MKKMHQTSNLEYNELHPTNKKMPEYSPYGHTPVSAEYNKSKQRAK